jgi:hypothetical protein
MLYAPEQRRVRCAAENDVLCRTMMDRRLVFAVG